MSISASDIAKLRSTTGAGMMDCKNALEEANGDQEKAMEILRKKGILKAAKRADKVAAEGVVASYIHGEGKIGVLVELNCETDFVAKTEDFQHLGREIAMQCASMKPENVESLLAQDYLRDSSQTIEKLIKAVSGKTGENIRVLSIAVL